MKVYHMLIFLIDLTQRPHDGLFGSAVRNPLLKVWPQLSAHDCCWRVRVSHRLIPLLCHHICLLWTETHCRKKRVYGATLPIGCVCHPYILAADLELRGPSHWRRTFPSLRSCHPLKVPLPATWGWWVSIHKSLMEPGLLQASVPGSPHFCCSLVRIGKETLSGCRLRGTGPAFGGAHAERPPVASPAVPLGLIHGPSKTLP